MSARGGSGPQQARGGLQEAIRGLRQDASQIQLGRAGAGSGLSAAACQSEPERAGVQLPEKSEWNMCVCVRVMELGLYECASRVCVCSCSCVRVCARSVTVGKLQAGSLGKCSPIYRNQWRVCGLLPSN